MEVNFKSLGALSWQVLQAAKLARREREDRRAEALRQGETAIEEVDELRGYVLEGGPEQRMPEGK